MQLSGNLFVTRAGLCNDEVQEDDVAENRCYQEGQPEQDVLRERCVERWDDHGEVTRRSPNNAEEVAQYQVHVAVLRVGVRERALELLLELVVSFYVADLKNTYD